jgi:hypothetical protein
MQAPKIETQTLPPPPGIIGSLRAGFDVTTGNIAVILMPLALDLFLWLGPRLSVNTLAQPALKYMDTTASANPNTGLSPAELATRIAMYHQAVKDFNWLSLARTFPIGISSLISGKLPGPSPLGAILTMQVDSLLTLAAITVLVTLIGWILGGLYFRWVATLVTPESSPALGRAVTQTLLYSLICLAVSWILGLPAIITLGLIFMISSIVGEIILVILAFISMWLIVPVFFSAHGIFVKNQNAFASILGSFQLARFTLPTSSLFTITIFMVSFASNLLWGLPANDSWFTLVGIFGHAFITTALLAATFVYYKNMTTWLQTVLTRLRNGMTTIKA